VKVSNCDYDVSAGCENRGGPTFCCSQVFKNISKSNLGMTEQRLPAYLQAPS
jgi:hypothetical protein